MTGKSKTFEALGTGHCTPCAGGTPPLDEERTAQLLEALPGWELCGSEIARTFTFKNYFRTIAFVNAIAWIAHRENHHPDLEVGYNSCRVRYSTHAIGGLSENDFICAARVEGLLDE
ncbi:MAG TPA: 4a-hydroxytetrahydrobiopterin dehydratase [Desulfuromonadales bacterium]|nr:4a-hydroxytetrahydrobiopterin dehydratase [Desulfuromonadales bacterium]